ncbi:MAG: UvrB/UvrC motif-containing protein, partial [Clostridiales bacterium]|nr:UvrB/UvrC motif-containing protein [Clostridiales bacterium]
LDEEETSFTEDEKKERLLILQQEMRRAARELEFEQAAKLRDEIRALTGEEIKAKTELRPGMIGAHKRARGRTRK